MIDGNAVRTIDIDGTTESAISALTLTMSLLPLQPLVALFALLHSNWTRSPPLTDKAIIVLGETNTLASSQPLPASTRSEI